MWKFNFEPCSNLFLASSSDWLFSFVGFKKLGPNYYSTVLAVSNICPKNYFCALILYFYPFLYKQVVLQYFDIYEIATVKRRNRKKLLRLQTNLNYLNKRERIIVPSRKRRKHKTVWKTDHLIELKPAKKQ